MKITLLLILIAAIAYFLGGINGAIITSRYIYRRDVRASGSGCRDRTSMPYCPGKKPKP